MRFFLPSINNCSKSVLFLLAFFTFSLTLEAQISPSGQSVLIAPATLSACSRDTVKLVFTNKEGPTCGGSGNTPSFVTYTVKIPSDNTSISYEEGSVSSVLPGATATVSGGNLIIMAPVPGFGASTEVKFVVRSKCEVVPSDTLPYFSVVADYPAGFTTTNESWTGSKMNTGVAQINVTFEPSYYSQIVPFNTSLNQVVYVTNNGYGSVDQLKYNAIIDDSLVGYIQPGKDWAFISGANVPYGSYSLAMDGYPDGQVTQLPGGKRYVSFTIKGTALDAVDGRFDNGDRININDTYLKTPSTCVPDMIQKIWIEPICAIGGAACSKPDTLTKVFKISAGTPILSGLNASVDAWDGCPDKNASFTYKNTGTPDANNPEVGTAYDLNLSVAIGGLMSVKDLLFAGVSTVPTEQNLPGATRAINWKIKDKLDFDPDGPGGLQDLDGDGFFDDMRPGDSINVSWKWEVPCDLACGADMNYNMTANSSFTDYCRKLNGTGSVPIYRFGFAQTAPVVQLSPLPNYGTMGLQEVQTRVDTFEWNYSQYNVDLANAVVKLRINYSKTFEVVEPIEFLGTVRSLSDFTVIGAGLTPVAGTTAGTFADAANNTVDVDSALEYTLTYAEMLTLFDNVGDRLLYGMTHVSCDSFQNQTNNNNFQLMFSIGTAPCPSTGVPPCGIDLACKKSFAYTINEGCGIKPCYIVSSKLERDAAIGTADVSQTGGPNLTAPTSFYVGDTLTKTFTAQLSGDYQMDPIGTYGFGINLRNYFSLSYDRVAGTQEAYQPLLFVEEGSRVVVVDTITGDTIAMAPLKLSHFQFVGANHGSSPRSTTPSLLYDNIGPSDPYYGSYGGLMGYYCNFNSWVIDLASCPYNNERRYIGSPIYFLQKNLADTRVSENYYMSYETALTEAGYNFAPGFAKYKFIVDSRWSVNPDYPHTDFGQFLFKDETDRYADGNQPPPAGQYMSSCGTAQSVGTIYLKELSVVNPGATYNSTCGLTINNALYLKSATGDNFPGGEVRVPYKLDSVTIDLPTEYEITGGSTYAYHQSGAVNAGTATNSVATNHVVWTSNGTNGEFPRMDDQAGNNIVHNLSYAIDNVGTDNFLVDNYRVPVVYFLRDEFGKPFKYIDTINIVEGVGDITLTALGGVVQIADSDDCSRAYMDVLIANNTLYSAGSALINIEGTANSFVEEVKDLGTPLDPIDGSDTGRVSSNRLFALLGALAPAEQRIVRVYFSTDICEDSIKFVTNFGCNYPANNDIYINSNTLDSTYIRFNAIEPKMMVGAITPKINVATTCDVVEVIVELANVKEPNLYNIMAGFKLPANVKYVPGTMIINATNCPATCAFADYAVPSQYITGGANAGDSIIVNVDPVHAFHNAAASGSSGYYFLGCGLVGPDVQMSKKDNTLQGPSINKVRIKFKVEFESCPINNVDVISFDATATNYCGLVTKGKAAVNILYQGQTGTPNTYSCSANNATPFYICSEAGETQHILDSINVGVLTGAATTGADSMTITIGQNTASFTLSNFTAAAPWSNPSVTTTPEGRSVLTFAVPAGYAAGTTILLPLEYDLTVVNKDFCDDTPNLPCADIAHSISFFSTVNVSCPAKGLVCTSISTISRGVGYVGRGLSCCAAIGNYVWMDMNNDGIQDLSEAGVPEVRVVLYNAAGVAIDSTLTDGDGKYFFENLIPGDYSLDFVPPTGTLLTKSNTPGDNKDNTNSDASLTGLVGSDTYGRTPTFTLSSNERDSTVDAGIVPMAAIGNFVWEDFDADGIQDLGEPGVAGVAVELYYPNGQRVYDPFTGAGLLVYTDANGKYLFDSLPPAKYVVWANKSEIDPTGATYNFSPYTGGADNQVDTNNDGQTYDAEPEKWVFSDSVALSPGEIDTTIDFGIYKPASLGNFVWADTNNDGIQDAAELGIEGVVVNLYTNGPDGSPGTSDDVFVKTTTTDTNGNYLFADLVPGGTDDTKAYNVGFVYPVGFQPTQANTPGDNADNTNSDAGTTPGINAGEYRTGSYQLVSGESELTVDAGVVPAPCVTPMATLAQTPATCSGAKPNNDGKITFASATNADKYFINSGATSTGTYATATAVPTSATDIQTSIPNAGETYTIRLYNGAEGCFKDTTIVVSPVTCNDGVQSCNCKEYIYLNEPDDNAILKFEVGGPVLLTEKLGTNGGVIPQQHWYPGLDSSLISKPHGVTFDLNGNIYSGSNALGSSNVKKLNCDGEIDTTFNIATGGDIFNMFSIDNTLFKTSIEGPQAYDLCTQDLIGVACLSNTDGSTFSATDASTFSVWGLSYNATTEKAYVNSYTGNSRYVWVMSKDELITGINSTTETCTLPLLSRGTATQTFSNIALGDKWLPNDIQRMQGVTSDNAGNIYLVTWRAGGTPSQNVIILKYNALGEYQAQSLLEPTMKNTHGIVWSETNRLYLANRTDTVTVDCISVLDADNLAYLGAGAPNPNLPASNSAKAISIIKECCPVNLPTTFSKDVCAAVGTKFYLNKEAFSDCNGTVCGSSWTPQGTLTNMTFDPCDNSVTINGIGCGTFALNVGAVSSTGCTAQSSTFTICSLLPQASLTTTPPTCTGATPNNDGKITFASALNADKYFINSGTTSTGTYATATAVPTSPTDIQTMIPNTGGSYTIRLYNGSEGCFTDTTLTIATTDCTIPCPTPICLPVSIQKN